MKENKIKLENFDFHRFADSIIFFASDFTDLDYLVSWVKKPGEAPMQLENCTDHDVLLKALDDGKSLFFPFSESYLQGPIRCANSKEYIFKRDLDKYDAINEEDVSENSIIEDDGYETILVEENEDSDICIGDVDCLGYLVQKKDGLFLINTAINFGGGCPVPPPSIDLLEDCCFFEQPMREFIDRFIKK